MYRSISLEEDLALKKVITDRAANTEISDRFAWHEAMEGSQVGGVSQVIVTAGSNEEELSLSNVADTIGSALTDLLISRKQNDDSIFNEENRSFVSNVANRVATSLTEQVKEGGQIRLTQNDLYLLIELSLIHI